MQIQKLMRFTKGTEKRKDQLPLPDRGEGMASLGVGAIWEHWEVPGQRFLQLVGTMGS